MVGSVPYYRCEIACLTPNVTPQGVTKAPAPAPAAVATSGSNPGTSVLNTKGVNASILYTDSYLFSAYLFPVNKSEALAYLDQNGPIPGRYARVVVVRGAQAVPDVMEYKVNAHASPGTTLAQAAASSIDFEPDYLQIQSRGTFLLMLPFISTCPDEAI